MNGKSSNHHNNNNNNNNNKHHHGIKGIGSLHLDHVSTIKQLVSREIKFVPGIKPESRSLAGVTTIEANDSEQTKIKAKLTNGAKKTRLFDRHLVDKNMNWHDVSRVGPGLRNVGNTCYFNAVTQCLTYCAPFANLLRDASVVPPNHESDRFSLLSLFSSHLKRALGSLDSSKSSPSLAVGKTIVPMEILKALYSLSKGRLRHGRQEDSHEATRLMLDCMHSDCLRLNNMKPNAVGGIAETTLIYSIFGGMLQSQLSCPRNECGSTSETFDRFLDLSIDLRPRGEDSVKAALERYSYTEILDKNNQWKCNKCGKLVQARKRLSIKDIPNILVLHLKRFANGPYGGKINGHVHFDFDLDIAPYTANGTPGETGGKSTKYKLAGVLVHSGFSNTSGHYYSYIRGPNDIWYEMDDESVSQVKKSRVLSQQAYMLFYQRVVNEEVSPRSDKKEERKRQRDDDGDKNSLAIPTTPTTTTTTPLSKNMKKPIDAPFSSPPPVIDKSRLYPNSVPGNTSAQMIDKWIAEEKERGHDVSAPQPPLSTPLSEFGLKWKKSHHLIPDDDGENNKNKLSIFGLRKRDLDDSLFDDFGTPVKSKTHSDQGLDHSETQKRKRLNSTGSITERMKKISSASKHLKKSKPNVSFVVKQRVLQSPIIKHSPRKDGDEEEKEDHDIQEAADRITPSKKTKLAMEKIDNILRSNTAHKMKTDEFKETLKELKKPLSSSSSSSLVLKPGIVVDSYKSKAPYYETDQMLDQGKVKKVKKNKSVISSSPSSSKKKFSSISDMVNKFQIVSDQKKLKPLSLPNDKKKSIFS